MSVRLFCLFQCSRNQQWVPRIELCYGGSNVVIKKHEYQHVIRWNNNGKGASVNPYLEPVKYLKKKMIDWMIIWIVRNCIWYIFWNWLFRIIWNFLLYLLQVFTNIFFLNFSVPTLGQIQNNYHPGYVPSSKPHLPTLSGTYSRPQASETFKVHY